MQAALSPDQPPLVSCIIIFLNGERFIAEAIESVRAQSYPHWELLLCDDGSTDGSTRIAREYASREPHRIRHLEHPGHANRGMSAARNLGIRAAKGQYVAFLDCDDLWLEHKLRDQVARLEATPQAAMLFSRTHIWYGWTGRPQDAARDYLNDFPFADGELIQPPDLLRRFIASEKALPCTCGVLIRRATFDRYGLFEESFRSNYEDLVFYTKVFLHAPVLYLDGNWDRYRQHGDSACAVALASGAHSYSDPNPARGRYLNWVRDYLRSHDARDPEVWRILHRQLWPYDHPWLMRARRAPGVGWRGLKRIVKAAMPLRLEDRTTSLVRKVRAIATHKDASSAAEQGRVMLTAAHDRTIHAGDESMISVIIPVYNAAPYLDEAVQSVLDQTCRNWELLLIEDGSTDGSDKLVEQWVRRVPGRIRHLHHPRRANRGMSASRNLGLRKGRGRYVAFLDADDVWLSEKLDEQLALLRSHPSAVMSYGPLTRWYAWTQAPQDADRDYVMELGVAPDTLVDPPDLFEVFMHNEGIVPSNGLMLRDAALAVGGYEERFRGMYEDQAFHAKLCLRYPVYAAGKSWVLYRQHPASCCHVTVSEGRHRQAKVEFLEWLMGYLRQQRITDPHVNRLVRDQWLPLHRPGWARCRELVRSTGRKMLPSSVIRRLRRRPDKAAIVDEPIVQDAHPEVRA